MSADDIVYVPDFFENEYALGCVMSAYRFSYDIICLQDFHHLLYVLFLCLHVFPLDVLLEVSNGFSEDGGHRK